MEKHCKCVNIQYTPKVFTGEKINVGVAFHNIDDNRLYFKKIRKTSRIKAFDDELDINEFKSMLRHIEEFIMRPFRKNLFDEKVVRKDEDYLENASRMFLNKYQFSNIVTLYTETPEKDFDDYSSNILYYDLDKDKRPTNKQTASLMNKVIYSAIRKRSLEYKTNPLFRETLGEIIRCDYKVKNKYFKAFNLDANNYNLKYNSAKTWYYNSRYFKDNEMELVFVLSRKPENSEEMIIRNILSESNSEVLYLDQLDEYVKGINHVSKH
jgi:hypothetical protein